MRTNKKEGKFKSFTPQPRENHLKAHPKIQRFSIGELFVTCVVIVASLKELV
jgi:hypothetical protein